ncbi:hypothetical protein Cni_G06247 [Canna indica]|uniref:Reverse transcriptase n=1 Tax=Canna indica TaxID=4628 RepID=A0AAQ3Q6C0_9LILI|nr:hypothetical protein Cni_G06247 [Canna indica]
MLAELKLATLGFQITLLSCFKGIYPSIRQGFASSIFGLGKLRLWPRFVVVGLLHWIDVLQLLAALPSGLISAEDLDRVSNLGAATCLLGKNCILSRWKDNSRIGLFSEKVMRAYLLEAKGKARWLSDGDRNTKFFHSVASGRMRKNWINTLKLEGRILNTEDDISKAFTTYFKRLLGTTSERHLSADWPLLYCDENHDLSDLVAPCSEEEILRNIKLMGKDKALGPDGLTTEFF